MPKRWRMPPEKAPSFWPRTAARLVRASSASTVALRARASVTPFRRAKWSSMSSALTLG